MATDSSMTGPWAPRGTTLVDRMGVGSVFEVARVRDERNRELIAKRIGPHARAHDVELALQREREVLEIATSVRCSCLPQLVASGTDGRGAFVVETLAPGVPLRELAAPPFLPSSEWSAIARAASAALVELHELKDDRGALLLVHGDVSPDNLFVRLPDLATFIDLSHASFRDAPLPALAHGRGTLPYSAPEIARNEAAPNQSSDTYALAATLVFLATGPLTDAATDASRLLEVGTQGLRLDKLHRRTDLPERARAALAGALRFEARARLVSARDLAHELSL